MAGKTGTGATFAAIESMGKGHSIRSRPRFSSGWLGTGTTKLEAANRAVHAAAEVVNESARLQADQNVAITEAITAPSTERAQLAGH